ncbi:alpha-amylase family glycosyl hydrolase [Breznakiella homolactica]|uniref:Glycosyl hydrolase family 13 catalytic domain-containing protein n=1 Tax=Breznakiella homolactica TaxID=2798577 RepID=A0A7T7XNF6_9SPIR|nr:alpha-amylase family glycosyl hydrolase [Breznakiella homolactica]QQO09570.1 hypothetical protein JFL75_01230 [Breznakiella homolactica]
MSVTIKDGKILFSAGKFNLEFSEKNGAWTGFSAEGKTILRGSSGLAPITLTLNGVMTQTFGREQVWSVRDCTEVGADFLLNNYKEEKDTLILTYGNKEWTITETFAYNASKVRVERTFRIAHHGEKEELMRWTATRMPVIADEDDWLMEMPGFASFLHEKVNYGYCGSMKRVFEDTHPAPDWNAGVIGLAQKGFHMISQLYAGDTMPIYWRIWRGMTGTWFEQKWLSGCRIAPADEITLETQYLYAGKGEFLEGLNNVSAFLDEAGLVLKDRTPDWGKEVFICEAHVGVKKYRDESRWHKAYPTEKDMYDDLEYLKEFGYTVLELMPKFPWPGYVVYDYYNILQCYGDPVWIKKIIDKCHELGMRVFFDIVLHGVMDRESIKYMGELRAADANRAPDDPIWDRHPMLEEHPDWFMRQENGEFAHTYTHAFDLRKKEVRKYLEDVFAYYVREWDVDGFRVDAPSWSSFPNYDKGLPYHGYESFLGAYGLLVNARRVCREIKPDCVFFTEPTGPLPGSSCELAYIYDEIWVYDNIYRPDPKFGVTSLSFFNHPDMRYLNAGEIADWFAMRQKVLPSTLIKVHFCDAHDTHELCSRKGIYRRELFGIEQARNLFAYCCLAPGGGILNFSEAEKGSEVIYRTLIATRKKVPALLRGSCDYLAIKADADMVFTMLRDYEGQVVIPVLNFSGEDLKEVKIDVSALGLEKGKEYVFYDHFSSKRKTVKGGESLDVSLAGWGYQAWELLK